MIRWLLGWLLLFEVSTHGLGYHSPANVNACKSSQEILCSSSSCEVNETFATLRNGRQLSCFVSYVRDKEKGKETKGDSARPPESLQASCYKTRSNGRDKVAMDLAWEAKEEDVRNGSLTGFSLFFNGGEYRVTLELKGSGREAKMAECIKFRYICYGVKNTYLSKERKSIVDYSVYSVPRSRLGDHKNGLSDTYIVPQIDQCRDSPYQRDETPTTAIVPTTTVDSSPYNDSRESGLNTAAVLGIVLAFIVIAAAVCFAIIRCRKMSKSKGKQQQNTQRPDEVIEIPEPNTQSNGISTAPWQSVQSIPHPMKVLVIIDRTDESIRDKAHALVQYLRSDSNMEIISNLENSNPIIHEQREVPWYQKNSQWADLIIFINGVAVLRKLDEHRFSLDEFIRAIFSHFSSKTYVYKRNIFLEYKENDLDYINQTWPKYCKAFKINENLIADDKFLDYLRRCANTSNVNEQARIERQQEEQIRTSTV